MGNEIGARNFNRTPAVELAIKVEHVRIYILGTEDPTKRNVSPLPRVRPNGVVVNTVHNTVFSTITLRRLN